MYQVNIFKHDGYPFRAKIVKHQSFATLNIRTGPGEVEGVTLFFDSMEEMEDFNQNIQGLLEAAKGTDDEEETTVQATDYRQHNQRVESYS